MLMLSMSAHLSALLYAREPFFALVVQQLERASGNASIDVRLSAEISAKVHQKLRELGLDPHDTTGRELYRALINMACLHDAFLAKRLGGSNPADVNEMLRRIQASIATMPIPQTAWVLKHSVAKRLLKAMPPKNVMKQLNYRSVDSMLKREDIAELYSGLRCLESDAWLREFTARYKTLRPADFETRAITVLCLDAKRWGVATERFVRRHRHNIAHLKELGVVALLPLPVQQLPGITLAVLPQVLYYINDIRHYTAYFKLQQVRPDFGQLVANTLLHDAAHYVSMAGQPVHWRVVHRSFGRQTQATAHEHPDIFEPHVQPDDLEWRKVEETLYRLEPALHFWHDMDYVGVQHNGQTVSFNIMDAAVSYVNQLPYGQQSVRYFQEALQTELHMRYLAQPALSAQVLKQLDNNMFEPAVMAFQLRRSI